MEPSLIALEAELVSRVRRYLGGEATFEELAWWVYENQEPYDERFDLYAPASQLSSAVQLALFEDQHGDHTPASLFERISAEFAEIYGSRV